MSVSTTSQAISAELRSNSQNTLPDKAITRDEEITQSKETIPTVDVQSQKPPAIPSLARNNAVFRGPSLNRGEPLLQVNPSI